MRTEAEERKRHIGRTKKRQVPEETQTKRKNEKKARLRAEREEEGEEGRGEAGEGMGGEGQKWGIMYSS